MIPTPPDLLPRAVPVSTFVNDPQREGPECIERVGAAQQAAVLASQPRTMPPLTGSGKGRPLRSESRFLERDLDRAVLLAARRIGALEVRIGMDA